MISSPNEDIQSSINLTLLPRTTPTPCLQPSNNAGIWQQQRSRTRTTSVHYLEHNHHRILRTLQSCDTSLVQAWSPVLLCALVCAAVGHVMAKLISASAKCTEIPVQLDPLSVSFTHTVLRCRFSLTFHLLSYLHDVSGPSIFLISLTCLFFCDSIILTRSEFCKWGEVSRHIPLMSLDLAPSHPHRLTARTTTLGAYYEPF